MVKWLFGRDASRGVTEYFHMDDGDDHFWIETVQDETPLLEDNRQHFNEFNRPDDRFGEEIGGRTRVASIPPVKELELRRRGIWQDKDALKRWLNTAEAMPYRTRPGRI